MKMSESADKCINMIDVGHKVDIQRTDGRIHAAVISQVNLDTYSVTVEWVERGETKGKELDINTLIQLNPELKNLKMRNLSQERDDHIMLDEEEEEMDEENGDGEEEEEGYEEEEDEEEEDEGKNVRNDSRVTRGVTSVQSSMARRSLPAQQGVKNTLQQQQQLKHQQQLKQQQLKQPVKHTTSAKLTSFVRPPTHSKLPGTQSTARNSLTRTASKDSSLHPSNNTLPLSNNIATKAHTATRPAPSSQAATNKKKFSCVKEVEMIKQRREERRANQAQQKEAFEQNYDTSTLNWEFSHMIKEFKGRIDLAPVTSYSEPLKPPKICVCVRKRPVNQKELSNKEIDVITIPSEDIVLVHEPKSKVDLTRYLENHKFRFDYAFDDTADNEMVYRFSAKPLVESIFDRGMATCFAYGQTGSGKTHTMGGNFSSKGQQDCTKGIYALAAQDVFRLLNTTYKRLDLLVFASFFEIYGGKIFDLLNNKSKLRVLEDSKSRVQVCGLKEEAVSTVAEVLLLLERGSVERTSGVTSANNQSSRSHAIFQIVLKKRSSKQMHGKFSLIDLAGNERGKDTMCSERQTRMEGAEINKSLLALKECIRALGVKGSHLPFRVSQLTQVLKDSFTGKNSKTCMIAMISPGMNCCEHTLNTLRYADRVKELRVNDTIKGKANKADGDNRSKIEVFRHTKPYERTNNINNNNHNHQQQQRQRGQQQQYEEEEEGEGEEEEEDGVGDGDDVVTASDDNTNYDDDDDDDDDEVAQESKLDERELAMLRSSNGEEVSEEVLNYNRAIINLHQKEEEVITAYQQVIQEQNDWIDMDKVLLRMTERPDYDVEDFSNGVKDFIDKKIERLTAFKEMVNGFVDVIQYEESLGQKFNK